MKRITAIIFSLFAITAHAEFFDGNKLLQHMASNSAVEKAIGLGYVMGVFDSHMNVTHCSPGNVTAGQINDMVISYLASNPSQRHRMGDALASEAFKQVWPCANRNPGRSL